MYFIVFSWSTVEPHCNIEMTSTLARWRLKTPAFWLFTQPFVKAQVKENIKALRHWPLVTGGFPTQMASMTENVSIWWRHHVLGQCWKPLMQEALPCPDVILETMFTYHQWGLILITWGQYHKRNPSHQLLDLFSISRIHVFIKIHRH